MKKIKINLIRFTQFYQIYLSKIAKEKKIDQFIHVSALGVENAIDSIYAKSKLDGGN